MLVEVQFLLDFILLRSICVYCAAHRLVKLQYLLDLLRQKDITMRRARYSDD
jgi:hypothetical protein